MPGLGPTCMALDGLGLLIWPELFGGLPWFSRWHSIGGREAPYATGSGLRQLPEAGV